MRVAHSLTNVLQYATKISHDIIVPVAKNAKPFGFQKCRALSVRLLLITMMTTIKLNDDETLRAAEIDNIGTDRMLPSEFQALELTRSKIPP